MEIYYYICGVLIIFSIVEKLSIKLTNPLFIVSIAFFILFVGFRYNVGNDYLAYYENYIGINRGGSFDSKEPLYVAVNKLLSFELVIFFFSFFSFYYLYKAIKEFNETYAITCLLVFYSLYLITFDIHIIRQGLSISIVLYAYKFLHRDQKIKFVTYTLVASLFHVSALFVLPFTFILKKNLKIKIQFILLSISFLIALTSAFFTDYYYMLVENIPVLNKYLNYYRRDETFNYGFSLGLLLDIVILIFFMTRLNRLSKSERFIYNVFFVSVNLSLLMMLDPAALRLNYYFRVTNILLIPLIYREMKFRQIGLIGVFLISILYLYTTLNAIGEYGRGDRNLKYKTIFNKE